MSINRNIVECKEIMGIQKIPYSKVLIETLWNVKVREIILRGYEGRY